jgi:hypothetical protein
MKKNIPTSSFIILCLLACLLPRNSISFSLSTSLPRPILVQQLDSPLLFHLAGGNGRSYCKLHSSNNSNSEGQDADNAFLDEQQIDFTMGYMNKHHRDVLTKFVEVYTPLGITQMKKNAFSGGSYEILDSVLVGIGYYGHSHDDDYKPGYLRLEATVQIRSEKEPRVEIVELALGECVYVYVSNPVCVSSLVCCPFCWQRSSKLEYAVLIYFKNMQ